MAHVMCLMPGFNACPPGPTASRHLSKSAYMEFHICSSCSDPELRRNRLCPRDLARTCACQPPLPTRSSLRGRFSACPPAMPTPIDGVRHPVTVCYAPTPHGLLTCLAPSTRSSVFAGLPFTDQIRITNVPTTKDLNASSPSPLHAVPDVAVKAILPRSSRKFVLPSLPCSLSSPDRSIIRPLC